jgi:hypothetical protein
MQTKQQSFLFAPGTAKDGSIIKTTSYDQMEILKNIITLYCPNGIELDPTYSIGNFYGKIQKPKYCYDINPQVHGVIKQDCRKLPHADNSIKSINFDPPFLATSGPSTQKTKKGSNIILNRFGFFPTIEALWKFYHESLTEFHRVLEPNGILIFKCQDTVSCSKQYLSHIEIINQAITTGFYPIDLFILFSKNRIIGHNHGIQQHARKFHSYFIVFRKTASPIKYFSPS